MSWKDPFEELLEISRKMKLSEKEIEQMIKESKKAIINSLVLAEIKYRVERKFGK